MAGAIIKQVMAEYDFDFLLGESAKVSWASSPRTGTGRKNGHSGLRSVEIYDPKGKDRKNILDLSRWTDGN